MARAVALWEDPSGTPHDAPAMLEDISRIGACIRLKKSLSVGSKVTIQWRRERFSGTVRYCNKAAFDYRVGIQRDPATKPTEDSDMTANRT